MSNMQKPLYLPLHYPPGFPRPWSRIEQVAYGASWVPLILGPILLYWSAAWCMAPFIVFWFLPAFVFGWGRETRRADQYVEQQLAAREEIPDAVWGEIQRVKVARQIGEQLVTAIGWEHPRFIPEDPFEVLICWQTGDICELDAMWRIENTFEWKHKKGQFLGLPVVEAISLTFGDVVDRVLELQLVPQ